MKIIVGFVIHRITKTLVDNLSRISGCDEYYSVIVVDRSANLDLSSIENLADHVELSISPIHWASFSQVEAQVQLLEIAVEKGCSALILMSETDLFIKDLSILYCELSDENYPIALGFLKHESLPMRLTGADLVYSPESLKRKTLFWYEKVIRQLYTLVLRFRYKNLGPFYKGPNWAILNIQFIREFLDYWDSLSMEEITLLHRVVSADEIIFQSFAVRSFSGELFINGHDNDNLQAGWYIDWRCKHPPKNLDKHDIKIARMMGANFARKYEG